MDRTPYGFRIYVAKSKKFAFRRPEESFLSQSKRPEGTFPPDRKKASSQSGRKLPMQKDRTGDSTGDIHPLFLKFWEIYPRKVAKKESLRAFRKLNPDERLLEAMLKAVNRQRDSHPLAHLFQQRILVVIFWPVGNPIWI